MPAIWEISLYIRTEVSITQSKRVPTTPACLKCVLKNEKKSILIHRTHCWPRLLNGKLSTVSILTEVGGFFTVRERPQEHLSSHGEIKPWFSVLHTVLSECARRRKYSCRDLRFMASVDVKPAHTTHTEQIYWSEKCKSCWTLTITRLMVSTHTWGHTDCRWQWLVFSGGETGTARVVS